MLQKVFQETVGLMQYVDRNDATQFLELCKRIVSNGIPNSRVIAETTIGVRSPIRTIGEVEKTFNDELNRIYKDTLQNGTYTVKRTRDAVKRNYTYFQDPTTMLHSTHPLAAAIGKPKGMEIMKPHDVVHRMAPNILSWVVLWWSRNTETPNQIRCHIPLHLILSDERRNTFVALARTIGEFDEMTETMELPFDSNLTFADLDKRPKLITAMARLMYIEVEFNAARLLGLCEPDAVFTKIEYVPLKNNASYRQVIVANPFDSYTDEDSHFIQNMLNTVFRFNSVVKLDHSMLILYVPNEGETGTVADAKLVNDVYARAIQVVLAKYRCYLAVRDASIDLEVEGSVGPMPPPETFKRGGAPQQKLAIPELKRRKMLQQPSIKYNNAVFAKA